MPLSGYDYKTHLITWLDILGFKSIVAENDATLSGNKLIWNDAEYQQDFGGRKDDRRANSAMEVVRSLTVKQQYQNTSRQAKIWQFADTVVRLTELDEQMSEDEIVLCVMEEVNLVAEMQQFTTNSYAFLRGAIVMGPALFHGFKEDPGPLCFGPAVNRAHILESSLAVYPRILVDKMTVPVEALGKDTFIRRDTDNQFFVDYLATAVNTINLLPEHRDAILSRKKSLGGTGTAQEKLRQKYDWLEAYHNATVERYRPERPDWLIST